MTSSSPESTALVPAGPSLRALTPRRDQTWTRLGSDALRGDAVTEGLLGELAERTESAARAQGFAAGWAEGRRRAADQVRAEESRRAAAADAAATADAEHRQRVLAAALDDLTACAAAVREQLAALEARTAALAVDIAESVVGAELSDPDRAARHAVSRALSLVPSGAGVRLRTHPDVAAVLDVTELTGLGVQVVADPTLSVGDAVAENDELVVDATVGAALARVREVLR